MSSVCARHERRLGMSSFTTYAGVRKVSPVIPTMILVGLILGRWWWLALPSGALLWGGLLLATGATGLDAGLAEGMVLAMVNCAFGVGVHQVLLHATRRWRGRDGARPTVP